MKKTKGRASLFSSAFEGLLHGSACTRISAFVMGFGQWKRGQKIKGALYLSAQALYIAFMVLFGGRYMRHLFSGKLGTRLPEEIWNDKTQVFDKISGDNSFLILLYAVLSVAVTVLFVFVWASCVKGSRENDLRILRGEKIPRFSEDIAKLFDREFYKVLLFAPLLGLFVFTLLPLVFMVLIAFTDYDFNHMPPGKLFEWVGIANFKTMFFSSGSGFTTAFLRVLLWTFVWAFFATFTNYLFGMVVALLVNKKGLKCKKVFRTAFVLAIAVPQFVTLLLMQKVLDRSGILNVVLGKDILWLTDTRHNSLLPRISVILVNLWIGMPYTLLMCSGLLMNVPKDFYEAAKIDGATPLQAFAKITLPYMLQMTTPYLITQFVGNVNNFNVIWLLTGGGPIDAVRYGSTQAQSTDLLVTWLYRLTTDTNPRYNVASVIGIVIFVVSAATSLFAFNKSKSVKNEEAFQ